jgi:glycerol-3-phosphate dehydrogenase
VHGGVRYLQQGNIKLVMDALKERGIMKKNAAHLVKNQSFIVPNYKWWEGPYYGLGLKVYDWMSGSLGLGTSEWLSTEEVLELAREASQIPAERLQTRDDYLVEPWVIMVQIINHATEHREQIKSMLTALGVTPPSIDGWDYGEVTKALVPISK